MPILWRAMSILQGPSGLATDRYVNTFHFGDVGSAPDALVQMKAALDLFWAELDEFIPEGLVREDYRFYDMADPTPRPVTFAVPGSQPSGVGAALPFEVAACLSYFHERNVPRQRGRLFIGPLVTSAATSTGEAIDPRPTAALMAALIAAGEALQAQAWGPGGGGLAEIPWVVYSPTNGTHGAITDLWVDDAFDTMRSRGTDPTMRITASVIPD